MQFTPSQQQQRNLLLMKKKSSSFERSFHSCVFFSHFARESSSSLWQMVTKAKIANWMCSYHALFIFRSTSSHFRLLHQAKKKIKPFLPLLARPQLLYTKQAYTGFVLNIFSFSININIIYSPFHGSVLKSETCSFQSIVILRNAIKCFR